jgi:hypothetical protein
VSLNFKGDEMIVSGKISIFVGEETRIEVKDTSSNTTFLRINLDPIQFTQALGRLACVDCDLDVYGVDRIGKKHEHKKYEFQLPDDYDTYVKSERYEELSSYCQELLDVEGEGYICDRYFGSKDSFFVRDNLKWGRITIRRYV